MANRSIQKIIQDPESWQSLPPEKQRSLYALLPPVKGNSDLDTSIHPLSQPMYAEVIKDYIAYVERCHEEKMTTKAWEEEARLASQERKAGRYDEMKETEREQYWGQKGGNK